MKNIAKYFTSANKEEAIKRASKFFNTKEKNIYSIVKRQGNEVLPCLVLAYNLEGKSQDYIDNINSTYMLSYETDGVYFELYPRRGNGAGVNRESVLSYVNRKSIKLLNTAEMLSVLSAGEGRALIGPPQKEILLNEDIIVHITEDDMEGYIQFIPPDEGGAMISLDEIKEKITQNGIEFGIDEDLLKIAFDEKVYGKKYLVAKGVEPEDGQNGYLEYHFRTGPRAAAPKENENGRIDYRTLDLFEHVSEGQLLVTRYPATQGISGKNVRGKELKPRDGKEALMPRSKNTILNEDKTAMYAKFSGMVDFISGCLTVSNVYTIRGDCDMGVGNIDFDGSIVISGNVISGLVIKASGSITIYGVVEGSEITSGGDIDLKRGIQGMDKGKLMAGGSIYAQFIERSTVIAGTDVIADTIIHSNIEAGRSLIAKGKRGNIMGGNVKVTSEVIARYIGSSMNTLTEIEVGMVPQKRKRMNFLKSELKRIKEELEKLDKLEQYLKRKPANMSPENVKKVLASSKANRYLNAQLLEEYSDELSSLEYEMNNATEGKVHVSDTAYPGTRITISNGMYKVIEPAKYVTFKYRNGDVVFTAYEAKQN